MEKRENKVIDPPMSDREIKGAAISREAAVQGMVLLKNENHALPLGKPGKIGLFGNGAVRTIRGGTGSGDPFNGGLSGGGDLDVDLSPRYHIHIMDAMQDAGFEIVNGERQRQYAILYDQSKRSFHDQVMGVFAFPEQKLTEEELAVYAEETDTAICVIARNSGEGNDRSLTKTVEIDGVSHTLGDYELCEVERENIRKLRAAFAKLILVLNVAGPIAVEDLDAANADAILLMGQAGQEGGAALVDVLSGKVTPSGKLAATWAAGYRDYPTYGNFLSDPDKAVYSEGIYVGYRYFDTFDVKPGYPFGYGLSYTEFKVGAADVCFEGTDLKITAPVTNRGDMQGREVLQVYVSAPVTEMDMPLQELKGFRKTKTLAPGETEQTAVTIPLSSLASYSEEKGGYILSAGDYRVSLGTSSRDTVPVCRVCIEETVCTEQVFAEIPLKEALQERKGITKRGEDAVWDTVPRLCVTEIPETKDHRSPYADEMVTTYTTDPDYQAVMPYEKVCLVEKGSWTLSDVASKKVPMETFAAQFTAAQLADLCCGTGWGVADENNPVIGASSESVPGAAGETTHRLEDFGVDSIVLADGPGGVRITQKFQATDLSTGQKREVYHYCTAWPVGTLLAQSFDPATVELVGHGMALDMDAMGIDLLLGPGMNIQRDPMCGRNFEYFSEDPYVSGKMGAAMIRGLQSIPGCGGCIKHYAANNQETNRNTVNSVIGQRALREIYLEPFKIAVREGAPLSIMSSYNLLNGTPTADSYDLCTDLARGEWGFKGLIMTDWNGGSSTPWISMHAGNDLIMPGGRPRAMNILQAVETVKPEFDERGQVVMTQEIPFAPVLTTRWNSFTVCSGGTDTVTAWLGEGHTAVVEDGRILVDGAPIYLEASGMREFFTDREHFQQMIHPADTTEVSVTEDGKGIVYHGVMDTGRRLCLGDVQKCAVNVLRVIMACRKPE